MALNTEQSGIFSMNEFHTRSVLKLAPDAFIEINGSLTGKVISAASGNESDTVNFRGGVTTITTNASVFPPGSGNCNITVVCPQYDGLHESYYVENSDGTKTPYFESMMEVRVFMKGRYLADGTSSDPEAAPNSPRYYQVFWGFVTGVNESYSNGMTTFALNCRDMLGWWDYQKITITPSSIANTRYGGKEVAKLGTNFRNLNAWEIILDLFRETGFENFIQPTFLAGGTTPPRLPEFAEGPNGAFKSLSENVMTYWKNKFNFGRSLSSKDKKDNALGNLEMFGLNGVLDFSDNPNGGDNDKDRYRVKGARIEKKATGDSDFQKIDTKLGSEIDVDFSLLGKIRPFENYNDYLPGTEAITDTKLQIATKVAGDMKFEFFLDPSGTFVFKPPFYNMDVRGVKEYTIKSEDIISFNENFSSDVIINYLEVTGARSYKADVIQLKAVHVDFNSVARYGLRFQSMKLAYGNSDSQLRGLAVGEMGITNAKAFTGNIDIPLRPEMRLGYPIYVDHLDAYYYTKGISHNFTFGSTSTTTLTLEAKRSKIRDGEGTTLQGHIYKARPEKTAVKDIKEEAKNGLFTDGFVEASENESDTEFSVDASPKKVLEKQKGLISTQNPGFWVVEPSQDLIKKEVGSNVLGPVEATRNKFFSVGGELVEGLDELIHFTDDSNPYTDINGYFHIGAFPYGANLRMSSDLTFEDIKDTRTIAGSKKVVKDVMFGSAPDGERTKRASYKDRPKSASQNTKEGSDPASDVSQTKKPSSSVTDNKVKTIKDTKKNTDVSGILSANSTKTRKV